MQIYLSDRAVGACIFKENVSLETFNISFESTQNMQQYGTKVTTQRYGERKKRYGDC